VQTGSGSDIGEAVFIRSLLNDLQHLEANLDVTNLCISVLIFQVIQTHGLRPGHVLGFHGAQNSMYKQSDKKSEIPPSGIAWPADSWLCDGLPW
jgi:hypothetical protein